MASLQTGSQKSEIKIPKEHAPLDYLLSQIPKKAQKGMLSQCDLNLICIDANENFIAVGSNVGVVFLYNRKEKELERLRTHSHNDVITSVAVHSGLEHQVAVGTERGVIYLFQLPSVMPSQSKQLQQFIVKDVHKSTVTCVCWSLNGMKLFSGDKKGLVSSTEVDFYTGVCETNICLIENNSEIVQLNHGHKALLVSTNQRSLLYRTDTKVALIQVGQKDRKVFGKFGAVFLPGLCKPEDAELYACRPGLRIWKSKMDGTVSSTFLFKELINKPFPTLELLAFNKKSKMFLPESQFGPLFLYNEKYIVTWSDSSLFILNPEDTSVIAGTFHAGAILNIAVTKDEIFLLRQGTDRSVIRIADRPESLGGNTYHRLVKDKDMPDFMTETHVKPESGQTTPSPLRFLKENVIDKIINLEGQSSDIAASLDQDGDKKELPPVVKLDNPDLLTIEIFNDIPSPQESNVQMVTSPMRQERFNPFLKDDFHEFDDENELDTSHLSLCNKPKSEKYNSSQSHQLNTQSSQQTTLSSKQTTVQDQQTSSNFDRIKKVPVEESNLDIAVSVKTKKKKKKKPEIKGSPSLTPKHPDSDTASVNSSEGASVTEQTTGSERSDELTSSSSVDHETAVDISDILGLKPVKNVEIDENKTRIENKISETEQEKLEIEGVEPKSEAENPQKNVEHAETEIKTHQTVADEKEDNLNNVKVSEVKVPVKKSFETDSSTSQVKAIKTVNEKINVRKTEENIQKSEIVKSSHKFDIVHAESCSKTGIHTSSDIASHIHHKKHKGNALSKLEKNLASLEKGLDSNLSMFSTFSSVNEREEEAKCSKDHDSYLNLSQTDSGNDSMVEEKGNQLLSDFNLQSDMVKQETNAHSTTDISSSTSSMSNDNLLKKSQSSSFDDFYSKYNSSSAALSPSDDSALEETSEHPLNRLESQESQEVFDSKTESVQVFDPVELHSGTVRNFNTWTEVVASGNLLSLCISDTHVWFTDKSSNIMYSSTKSTGIKWQKANGYAKQISVSRSGMIVWRLYKDTVYAGTKITAKHPEGMKWVEAIRGVQSIAVENLSAWYIKTNGEVALQKGLSKERPCFKSTFIECSYKLQQIACKSGVVWAITDQCKLVYRAGIKKALPEGKEWAEFVSRDGMMFSCVTFGDGNVAWAVDILGRVYFMTNVTMETPLGDNCWWQVPIHNEVTATDATMIDTIKSLTKIFDPQKLADLLSSQKGGLISAGTEGVCVCPEFKNELQLCRGSIEGHIWNEAHLSGIVSSTAWKLISVSAIHVEWGMIWAQQANGELFTFHPSLKNVRTLQRPCKEQFVCLSVCEEATWGLNEDGKVFIRSGIASHCPQGAKWCDLDLKQLGDAHLIHLSCGTRNVWAVDDEGTVYQRIGVKAPTSHSLQAAWLPVDSGPTGTTFTQVFAGPSDHLVWAVDNRRQTYARIGITDNMPIGTSWVHIPGTYVHQLAISQSYIWALDPNGEVLCRHGVTSDNPSGDYWRKIPGLFIQISCSVNDKLWAIGREGQIFRRKTKYLLRKESHEDNQKRKKSSSISISEDWELV